MFIDWERMYVYIIFLIGGGGGGGGGGEGGVVIVRFLQMILATIRTSYL